MPGGDRTGPLGHGPMTGRSLGYCTGKNMYGYMSPSYGRGFGRGQGRGFARGFRGRGRGFGRGYDDYDYRPQQSYTNEPYQPTKDEEKKYLENMVKSLEEEIKLIQEKLQQLTKEKKE
jgi:hypothetical protein